MSTSLYEPAVIEKLRYVSGLARSRQVAGASPEAIYKEIVDRAPDGFALIQDGLLKYTNPKLQSILGYSREELLDTPFYFHVAADDEDGHLDILKMTTLRSESSIIRTTQLKKKDGSRVRVELNAVAINGGRDTSFLIVVRDVSGLRQTEEQLELAMRKLRQAMGATISAMAMTIETRDPYTSGHQRRVADLARAIAVELSFTPDQVECVHMAASIHDLGKIAIPAEILSKPGRISEVEYRLIQTHPQVAYDILKTIDFPWPIADVVLQHHERVNGTGYPGGLKGDEILPEAKVLAVADVVEAMVSHRPYRSARTMGEAIFEITQNRDILYDGPVVDACRSLLIEGRFRFKD